MPNSYPQNQNLNLNQNACVVLSFNHPDLTRKAVQSVLQFSWHKVYLVHNGSDEKNIVQLQKDFAKDEANQTLEHLIINKNIGFSGGANFGLQKAFKDSAQVLFITNDCELLFRTDAPPKGLVAPLILKRRTPAIDSFGATVTLRNGNLRHLKNNPPVNKKSDEKYYVPGTAFWMDRETFELTKGFDESLFTYWEDVDLSLRLQQLDANAITFDAKTIIRHGIGKTCHKNSDYTAYYFQRNKIRITWRHGQSLERPSFLAAQLLKMPKMYLSFKRSQNLKKFKNALRDGWDQRNCPPSFQSPE